VDRITPHDPRSFLRGIIPHNFGPRDGSRIPWSLKAKLQFDARLQRQGQDRPVFVHHIMVERTIEQRQLKSLNGKDRTQQSLLDAVNADLKRRGG